MLRREVKSSAASKEERDTCLVTIKYLLWLSLTRSTVAVEVLLWHYSRLFVGEYPHSAQHNTVPVTVDLSCEWLGH